MRITLALSIVALAAAGCGDDNTGGDQGTTQDLSVAHDLAGADLSMSMMPDLTGADLAGADLSMSMMPDLSGGGGDAIMNGDGGVGSPCTSACDCTAGLACFMGTCRMAMFSVYCCGSTDCPQGMLCQDPQGGMLHMCGGGGGDGGFNRDAFMFDAGALCMLIQCNNDNKCMSMGCGACDQNTNTCMAP
jgi:hypothetical protein